jgi:hypothetical protein
MRRLESRPLTALPWPRLLGGRYAAVSSHRRPTAGSAPSLGRAAAGLHGSPPSNIPPDPRGRRDQAASGARSSAGESGQQQAPARAQETAIQRRRARRSGARSGNQARPFYRVLANGKMATRVAVGFVLILRIWMPKCAGCHSGRTTTDGRLVKSPANRSARVCSRQAGVRERSAVASPQCPAERYL